LLQISDLRFRIAITYTATPTALAAAAQPATPVCFKVPRGACDCHTHIFCDPQHFRFWSGRTYTPEAATDQLTVLHAFTGGSDGSNPDSVVLDGAGHLYGTAATGGGRCRDQGCGVVFKITL
jgi:hypothetical protein